MKNRVVGFSSLGLVSAAFTPVMAADAGTTTNLAQLNLAQAPAPMVMNWTGFYAGGTVGLNAHRTKQSTFLPNTPNDNYCWQGNCSFEAQDTAYGMIGGLQAGFNYQFGSFVVGPEIDFSGATTRNELRDRGSYGWASNTGLEALGTARLRLGYTFDRALVYVTGGGALGKVVSEYRQGIEGGYSWSRKDDWRFGYAVGAGVEYAVGGAWSVKGEGLYYAFSKKQSHTSDNLPPYSPGTWGLRDNSDGMVLRIGVNRRF